MKLFFPPVNKYNEKHVCKTKRNKMAENSSKYFQSKIDFI